MDKIIVNRFLLVGYVVVTLFFIAFFSELSNPYYYIVKTIPAVLAVLLVFNSNGFPRRTALIFALLFCATGDLLLGIDRSKLFIPALVSFMTGNILFMVHILKRTGKGRAGFFRAAATVIYTVIIAAILLPACGKMAAPVGAYILVISSMAFTAALFNGERQWLVFMGAAFFMVADSTIAYDKFVNKIPYELYINFVLYYAAIFILTITLIRMPKKEVTSRVNEERVTSIS